MTLQWGEIWSGTEVQGGKMMWKDTGRTPGEDEDREGEDEGRDGDDASASQGSPNLAGKPQKSGEQRGPDSPSHPSEAEYPDLRLPGSRTVSQYMSVL